MSFKVFPIVSNRSSIKFFVFSETMFLSEMASSLYNKINASKKSSALSLTVLFRVKLITLEFLLAADILTPLW